MAIELSKINYQRSVVQKISFQASMERAVLNQRYWDEILEKLRKAGGGGSSSDPKFDRIAVSMQLVNFLSNKQIQQMIRNLTNEFLKAMDTMPVQLQDLKRNLFITNIKTIGGKIITGLINIISLIIRRDAPDMRLYGVSNQLIGLVGIISFRFKELIKEFDVKRKLKKIKNTILDFFVEMKEEILNVIDFLKSYLEFFTARLLKETP